MQRFRNDVDGARAGTRRVGDVATVSAKAEAIVGYNKQIRSLAIVGTDAGQTAPLGTPPNAMTITHHTRTTRRRRTDTTERTDDGRTGRRSPWLNLIQATASR